MELLRTDTVITRTKRFCYITTTHPDPGTRPVLFIHGVGGGAWYFENTIAYIRNGTGQQPFALDLPGHGFARRQRITRLSVKDYVDHCASFCSMLKARYGMRCDIVGHSMGGLIAQKLAESGLAHRAILIAPAPPHGIRLPLAARHIATLPDLVHAGQSILRGKSFSPSRALLHTLFYDPETNEEAIVRCMAMNIYESPVVIWQLLNSAIEVDANDLRAKTLRVYVIGMREDHVIPPTVVEEVAQKYGTRCEILPYMGHMAPLETGWTNLARMVTHHLTEDARVS